MDSHSFIHRERYDDVSGWLGARQDYYCFKYSLAFAEGRKKEHCYCKTEPSEQKDRKQTTSGTNKVYFPQEFMIYSQNVDNRYLYFCVARAETLRLHVFDS